jgi:thiol-disulfide isomerase/thioredoxin
MVLLIALAAVHFIANRNLVSGKMPQIEATTISDIIATEQIMSGPGIIYFWAGWCGICRAMQDTVDDILNEYPGLTIAIQSGDSNAVQQYMAKQAIAWPTIADTTGRIGEKFGIRGVPAIFIYDKYGQIKFSTSGYSSAIGIEIRLWLAGLE